MSIRQYNDKLCKYIDRRLAMNGAAQDAIKNKDPRELMVFASQALVGIRESSGKNDGPIVELIQETIGRAENEPWCMSFVQSCIMYAEYKCGIESPIYPSEHCLTVWNNTPKDKRVRWFPRMGAIVIWRRGSGSAGHTGFFIEKLGKGQMRTIEGNTTSGFAKDGSIIREGGGIYQAKRSLSRNGNLKVVGFLIPF